MGIKGKSFVFTCCYFLVILTSCSSSQLAQKHIDKDHVFSTYKLRNNPDKEAFHLKITIYEEDKTPSKRRLWLKTKKVLKPVTRHKSKEGHYYSNIITYSGMIPALSLGEGKRELDYMQEDTLKLSIWKSHAKIPPIPMKLGKSLEVVLYLNSADDY